MASAKKRARDVAPDAETLVQWLIEAGQRIPAGVREQILAFGPDIIPPLIALLEDEELGLVTAPGEGWGPIHAVDLLAELRAEAAVEPMLRRLATTDWLDVLHDRILQGLPRLGAAALEPALAMYAGTTDPDLQQSVTAVLSELGVHDDRIYEILTAELEEEPDRGAMHLAGYGDPRALPLLSAALDRHQPGISDHWMADHAVVELEDAIRRLGGELTPAQQAKVDQVLAPVLPRRRQLAAASRGAYGDDSKAAAFLDDRGRASGTSPVQPQRKIGRNEPCPCGSGKKYKKCCLGK